MSERFDANPNNRDCGADWPHTSRYAIARGFVKRGDVVIDGACGPGYGSAMLSEHASEVISMDKPDVFEEQWSRPNVIPMVVDLEGEIPDMQCDTWVSLETIEHLENPEKFLDHVTSHTRRAMIFSSPNKPTVGLTPFHKTNVELENFRHYMNKYPEWREYFSCISGYTWICVFIKTENYSLI